MANPTDSDLSKQTRVELIRMAEALHVADSDVMTRVELREAIARAQSPEPAPAPRSKSWLGVARGLVASVLEQGLNLPEAAALVRGDAKLGTLPQAPPPIATVTLARIYAAQGHLHRAIATLAQVLEDEPDHDRARELWLRFRQELEERTRAEEAAARAGQEPPARPLGNRVDPEGTLSRLKPFGKSEGRASPKASASADTEPGTGVSGPLVGAPPVAVAPASPEPAAVRSRSHSRADTRHREGPASSETPPATESNARTGGKNEDDDNRVEATAAGPSDARPAPNLRPPSTSTAPPGTAQLNASETRVIDAQGVRAEAVLLSPDTPEQPALLCWHWPEAQWPNNVEAKLFGFSPGARGSQRDERVFSLAQARGVLRVQGVPPGLVLRAVLGTRDEASGFSARLVAASVRLTTGQDVPRAEYPPCPDSTAIRLVDSRFGSPDTEQAAHW